MGWLAALNPFGALSAFLVGAKAVNLAREELDKWFNFSMSLYGSQFVTFLGTWGASIWALYPKFGTWAALILAFANALMATAGITYLLWKRSPLTKGIPLMIPSALAEKAEEVDTTYTETK